MVDSPSTFCDCRTRVALTELLLRLYPQQQADGAQTVSEVILVLAKPRHHDAAFDTGHDMLCQNFRLDVYLQVSSVLSFPQNAGQELRPTPKDFSYQLSNSIISIAQFQSGVTKQSAANELGLPLLLEDRVEHARHFPHGKYRKADA